MARKTLLVKKKSLTDSVKTVFLMVKLAELISVKEGYSTPSLVDWIVKEFIWLYLKRNIAKNNRKLVRG